MIYFMVIQSWVLPVLLRFIERGNLSSAFDRMKMLRLRRGGENARDGYRLSMPYSVMGIPDTISKMMQRTSVRDRDNLLQK